MSSEKLLNVEPQDLSYTLELKKKPSCSFKLFNKTQNRIAYKIMTTSPRKYQVRPNIGILAPRSSCDVRVIMLDPFNMQCSDKFLIKAIVASAVATKEDVQQVFNADTSGLVQESRMGVACILTPDAPSPSSSFSTSLTESSEMTRGELLDVHPSELRFPFEVKELSCSLRISNATENYVGFNIKATNPDNYSVQPNIGTLGPQSTCDIKVRIQAQTEILLNMKCKDKFLIQSTVATTKNITRQMFNGGTCAVDEFKLGVLYVIPSSSLYSKVRDWLGEDGCTSGGLFMKGITIGLLVLMLGYFATKLLSLIWSLTFVIMMLVIKMIRSEVSDKVEDWIVKCLATVCMHFFYLIFRREANMPAT